MLKLHYVGENQDLKQDDFFNLDRYESPDLSQFNIGCLVNIYSYGNLIKKNCLIVDIIKDHYFTKGLVVYLNGNKKECLDLEGHEGCDIKLVN